MRTLALSAVITTQVLLSMAQATFMLPSTAPTSVVVDRSLLSVSIEFFAFPAYMEIAGTDNCLSNIQSLRGSAPAVRIGGTTQDRATYDPNLATPVNYTVDSPADAPDSLTFGPSFFTSAAQLPGEVTIGLNRELDNIGNTGEAASQAVASIGNLLAIELGNEPDLYSTSSPIADGTWSLSKDGASQKSWFTSLSAEVGNIFQAAVYISYPSWSTAGLIPLLGDAIDFVKTFSIHAYPQSACNGASTDLESLMAHSEIVNFAAQFGSDAAAAHGQGKHFFLGETNSATCGGGGISPTFGAGLWVMDYVLQGALNNIERLYFHQGTIGNCAYCFWGTSEVFAPYYGAAFVSEFLGSTSEPILTMLDNGTSSIAAYAIFDDASSAPSRVLLYNSVYYDGTGTRGETSVSLSGLGQVASVQAKRLTAQNATAETGITIGGEGTFDGDCVASGIQSLEDVLVEGGQASFTLSDSEALLIFLSL